MHSPTISKIIFTGLFLAVPFIALANAGSPLVWFNVFHLVVINAGIGLIESSILSRYKLPNKAWLVILANYVSMAVGYYLILPHVAKPQYGGGQWDANTGQIMLGFALSFLATLIIEYPFFLASLKDKQQRKFLLKPFLVANIVTNAVMIGFYWLCLVVAV